MSKKSAISSSFLSYLCSFCGSYPRISDETTFCAYYRKCNRSATRAFFVLCAFLLLTQILRFTQTWMCGESWIDWRRSIILWLMINSVFAVEFYGCYSALGIEKRDFLAQMRARRRLQVLALFPTLAFTMVPFMLPLGITSIGEVGMSWTVLNIMQLHVCMWFVDGLMYKCFLIVMFNVGYFAVSVYSGRLVIQNIKYLIYPTVLALSLLITFDRQSKENFLLRQSQKRQKNMYERHLEKMQDPVLILNESELLFVNEAGRNRVATSKEKFWEKAECIVTESGESLGEVAQERLGDSCLSMEAVTQKKYFIYDGESDLLVYNRVVTISIIESVSSTSQKILSLAFHDMTEELLREQTRVEEKYKNMLFFSLSHELRTPLNIFQAFLWVSKKRLDTSAEREMYKNAKGAWRYLRNKISDILDYAQMLTKEFVLHKGEFLARDFVRRIEKATDRLLADKRKSIRLEFRVDGAVPAMFFGDTDRLEQVLFNLVSNAVKYTCKGTISLEVYREKNRYVFDVTDTGCGVDPEVAESLFSLKSSVETKTNDGMRKIIKSTGLSGLGLTVSKMICNRMGADIRVISTLGKGSTFSFSLPAECLDPPMPRSSSQDFNTVPDEGVHANSCLKSVGVSKTQHNKALTTVRKDRTRVLVVDDNELNRHVVKCMVNKLGFTTVEAGNGKEAVSKVADISKRGETLVVFMDLDMPVMDGIEATIEIRKNGGPRPYIIALTAFASEAERSKCMEVGMDGFISKPLTKESLVDAFKHIGLIE